jgi:hypothetical protein
VAIRLIAVDESLFQQPTARFSSAQHWSLVVSDSSAEDEADEEEEEEEEEGEIEECKEAVERDELVGAAER